MDENGKDTQKKITGFVLQGGGALGAFELGVIECLLDSGISPDVVSGVSIEAVNATVLCGHRHDDPKVSLHALWDDLTTLSIPFAPDMVNAKISIFGNPGMYTPRYDFFNFFHWTSYYNTAPLVETLEKHVDFGKLKPGTKAPRLILTATNIGTGKLEIFDSHRMQITPHHVLASGSLPPGFPATKATAPPDSDGTEHLYWDGGLFDNTPLSKVIDALQEDETPDKWVWVVNLFPSGGTAPANMAEVNDRMIAILFSNKMEKDLKQAGKVTNLIELFEKFDRVMSVIDKEDRKLKELVAHNRDEIDKLARPHGLNLETLIQAYQDLKALTTSDGYKAVKKYGSRIRIVPITNDDVSGGSDFSAARIRQRREMGYQAAANAIREEISGKQKKVSDKESP